MVITAKVVKGNRRLNDPLGRYSVYPSNGRIVRRAANPEGYQHSRSEKVRRARDALRSVMIRYSALDIYTKQLYTEGTALDNPILREYIYRKIMDEIRRRGPKPPPPLPSPWVVPDIAPTIPPAPLPVPNPNIDYHPWPYPGWNPAPQKHIRPGPNSYAHDHLPQEIPNPSRDGPKPGLPPDIPNPTDDRRDYTPHPVYIVVEVDPYGLSGTAYELYLEAKSKYRAVRRWIQSHKKEIIIVVIVGAIITFGYSLYVGGGLVASGNVILVDQAYAPYIGMLLPFLAPYPWEYVKDWYYKRLVIDWAKHLNIYAVNWSRGWFCYKEVENYGTDIYYNFYEGPDKSNKGKLAATVHLRVDTENRTSELNWWCGDSKDQIEVYYDGALLFSCNEKPGPVDWVMLYNMTKHVWGEYSIRRNGDTVTYAFEDRPRFGDGDYNDAYIKITYDDNGNPIMVRAIEGEHCDELWLYWRGQLIGWFPRRC